MAIFYVSKIEGDSGCKSNGDINDLGTPKGVPSTIYIGLNAY